MRNQLSMFSNEMVSFRQDLRSLANALDDERHERLTGQLALVLDKEYSKRLSCIEKLSQEGHCFSVAGLEATRTCMTSVEELSSALSKERRERADLEASMQQALQVMQAGIEQEAVQRTNLGKDLKSSWDQDLTVFKVKCEEHEQLVRQMKEIPQLVSQTKDMLEAVERERQDRIQDPDHMKKSLVEMRASLHGARQQDNRQILKTLSGMVKHEAKEREHSDNDIRRQLDELRTQLDEILTKFHAKLRKFSSSSNFGIF